MSRNIPDTKYRLTPLEELMILASRFSYTMDMEQTAPGGPWMITATPRADKGMVGRPVITAAGKNLDKVADTIIDKMLEKQQ